MVQASFEYFQGPIPSPQVASGYERAMPGSAERIFALAERQAVHRQRIEARGQMLGFVVAMTAVVGGLGLIVQVDPTNRGVFLAKINPLKSPESRNLPNSWRTRARAVFAGA